MPFWGGVTLLLAGAVTTAVAKPRHSLFWIKMEYWGGVLSLGGPVMIVAGMIG